MNPSWLSRTSEVGSDNCDKAAICSHRNGIQQTYGRLKPYGNQGLRRTNKADRARASTAGPATSSCLALIQYKGVICHFADKETLRLHGRGSIRE